VQAVEISQQQVVLAMAVQSSCLSLLERTRQFREQSPEISDTLRILIRASDLGQRQLLALHQGLVCLAHSTPSTVTEMYSLRFYGLTQQAYALVSQLNLDRRTTLLGTRATSQIPQEQRALQLGRALDTWEIEVIQAMLTLAEKIERS